MFSQGNTGVFAHGRKIPIVPIIGSLAWHTMPSTRTYFSFAALTINAPITAGIMP
jgi:hypothetical protein